MDAESPLEVDGTPTLDDLPFNMHEETPSEGIASTRPYWVPPGLDYDSIPQGLRAAFTEILQPAYFSLVVMPSESLERSTGLSVVHLLCHEMLEQFHLGQDTRIGEPEMQRSPERQESLRRLFQIIGKKHKMSDLLHRLRMLREKNDPFPGG